ncbi:ubiquitin carboxyl-terminal hydrolase 9 [Dorcoceras hygrometricum]|uniref:Ubiquitin carboxyl-terminal hydrolase n=1 Tax=Dorcoceras hygrometricum TaxID=472368 RepID=A0A2Z7AMS8_9LAMI|nr:ubiquitin carboxyl-terminal hydrolase 9 [Dorcoceras hygrometricum]
MTIPDSSGCHYMMENGFIELPCKPEEERRIVQELTTKAEANLQEGNLYYVISSRWFIAWQKYTRLMVDTYPFNHHSVESVHVTSSNTENRPGPIDNSDIVVNGRDAKDDDPEILRHLEEGRDYVLVPQEVWDKLLKWYKGGPSLPRKMISVGDQQKHFSVEVYPLCLKLTDSRDQSEVVVKLSKKAVSQTLAPDGNNSLLGPSCCSRICYRYAKPIIIQENLFTSVEFEFAQSFEVHLSLDEASVRELYEKVCRLKGLDTEKVHIWDCFNKQKQTILISSNQTLEESNLQMDQDILLEVPIDEFGMDSTGNGLALVPVEPRRSPISIAGGPTMTNGYSTSYSSDIYQRSTFTSSYGDMEDGNENLKPVRRGDRGGLAGLQNLGNTCFMNSSIQCLAHTQHLVEYFLQDYSDEINRQNPLGMHGELALSFGELLRKLWSSGRNPVAPRAFKGKLARFAPQFSGYNQHDSQELLAFLLDGLHEDLNRVKQKPYIETKDFDGRPDKEVADEFWRYHKARNDSVIVDICQGQYKSTLVCPVCDKISITFDPFMYLSLPLPSTATRTMTITVFYGDGSGLPMPFIVTVLKQGCCKDLIHALATACCLRNDEYLLLAEVYEHRIYRYLENPSEPLADIKDEEHIVAYRLTKTEADLTRLEISHRYQESERKLFLTPLVTVLENPQYGSDIYHAVEKMLFPLRRTAFFTSATQSGEENGSALTMMEEQMKSCDQLEHMIKSTDGIEPEGISSRELSFRLCVTDDKGYGCRPITKDSPVRPARLIKVVLDWTGKEHDLYAASYLKDLPVVHKSGVIAKKTKQEAISLFSCLDAFLKEEPLGPDDMWYCPRCKEHRQASKKLDLWRLPDVLVFHLKRFSYSRWQKNKLDTFVNFPIQNLDLSRYVKSNDASEGSHVYELYAISNHYGGLGGGHYSAYCKLIDDRSWYHFDDSHVSAVSESEIKTSAAYVLFYQRVKPKSNGAVGEPSEGHRAF